MQRARAPRRQFLAESFAIYRLQTYDDGNLNSEPSFQSCRFRLSAVCGSRHSLPVAKAEKTKTAPRLGTIVISKGSLVSARRTGRSAKIVSVEHQK